MQVESSPIPRGSRPPADRENRPLRRPQLPGGSGTWLYRRLHGGDLARFDVLDTRQYRSDQAYGDGAQLPWATCTTANPHMRFYDGRRGYVTVALGRDLARADFRTVPCVTRPGAPVTTAASFVTEVGDQGLKPA